MTQVAPAFWVRYRGPVDPQIPNNTPYNYTCTYQIVGNSPQNLLYGCLGPAQLTREKFIEIKWTPIIGLVRVTISRASQGIFQSNGAEGGFIDQGQVIQSSTGVRTP